MKFIPSTLFDLVNRFGGNVQAFVGPVPPMDQLVLQGIQGLSQATPGHMGFLSNPKLKAQLLETRAAVVLIKTDEFASLRDWCLNASDTKPASNLPLAWLVDDPYLMYAHIQQWWVAQSEAKPPSGIHASAVVDESASVDDTAFVGPNAVVGARATVGPHSRIEAGAVIGADVTIGAHTRICPNVVVYHECEIGQHCLIHSGAIVGADGFGFANSKGVWVKIPQVGRVLVSDHVEIGANTTIDRGALGDTLIGFGVKLDNQIQIAHNVEIGEHTAFAGCSGVAGSTKIGARCTIGGSANIVGHLTLVEGTHVSAATTIMHSIHKPGVYTGIFPMDTHKAWEKTAVALRQIMKLRLDVRDLKNKKTQTREDS